MARTYRLARPAPRAVEPPVLDASQQAVVDHAGGPLLVLAGPGTGKTTTLVESVVDRIERRGLDPEQVLVLTFSRKAAEELRDRITARVGRTTSTPLSSTFHAFCYALLRRQAAAEGIVPPRLLSGAEHDVRVRELLVGSRESGRAGWPDSLVAALPTRGLAEEVRAVLARARELGLEPADLDRAGRLAGRPEWQAAGAFFEEYLQVLDAEGVLDYAELVHRAVLLAERDDVRRGLRRQFAAVFVDEYQDTDPAQVRLLQAIAGDGRDLVVVGDPDQSIYAFRGADVRGLLRFPQDFPSRDGRPAPVLALTRTRRFGPELLAASRRIAARLGAPGTLDPDAVRAFRSPAAGGTRYGPGRVEALTFPTAAAESAYLADLLRRAHLDDGVPWSEMAVLVRSAVRSLPPLRQALAAAGIPVEVARDELPLAREPAVQTLLAALRAAADPATLTAETARSLLLSPLGGLDAADLRRLGRALREADRSAFGRDRPPRPSGELVRDALADPQALAARRGDRVAAMVAGLGRLLARVTEVVNAGRPPEEALWALWSGTAWPRRLRAAVDAGGAAARAAHRDLDAVCALFEAAARAEERRGHRGVLDFLEELDAEQIPSDPSLERGVRGSAVRLLTAHRAKGLEWRLVVLAGVQEGAWPDLRRRGSLLEPDRLAADGLCPPLPAAALLAEERRLFYVAVTRARQRLVVTAVESPDSAGDQPSRFLTELGVPVRHATAQSVRPLSLAGLVGELRRVCADPGCPPALRRAAAARLARLADARGAGGVALAPAADPAAWWGLAPWTRAPGPVCPPDEPVQLSASAVSSLLECPLRWFLSRLAAGEPKPHVAAGFGRVLHTLADEVARGGPDPDLEVLRKHLEQVWDQLPYDSPWLADRERAEAEAALGRLATWHRGHRQRRLAGSEVEFCVDVPVDGDRVVVRGALDRVEVDSSGAAVVVDFKTGRTAPSARALREHPQLGIYQLAVDRGSVPGLPAAGVRLAGAELVHLRLDDAGSPKVQRQPSPEPQGDGRTLAERQLAAAAALLRAEDFPARPSAACRTCPFRRLCPAAPASRVRS